MKQILSLSAMFIVAFLTMSFVEKDSVSVDTAKSQITWTGYKVTGQHTGTIDVKSGSLDFEGEVLVGGYFELDMTTIKTTDMDPNKNAKLDGHLKSEDFFGVEKYPAATFSITKVVSRGKAGEYKIIGDLTIKETTKEIKFLANVDHSTGTHIATAKVTIDRSDFDVRYGSGSFFENLGDKTIYDDFDLNLSIVAAD